MHNQQEDAVRIPVIDAVAGENLLNGEPGGVGRAQCCVNGVGHRMLIAHVLRNKRAACSRVKCTQSLASARHAMAVVGIRPRTEARHSIGHID